MNTTIDQLLLEFSLISISKKNNNNSINQSTTVNMTAPVITDEQLKSFCQTIPYFSPEQNDTLSTFIVTVDDIIKLFESGTFAMCSNVQVHLLNLHIVSKLKDTAHTYITSNKFHNFIPDSFATWKNIRKALLEQFGQAKSEDTLFNELQNEKQKFSEHYRDFHLRLNTNFNILMKHVQLVHDNEQKIKTLKEIYSTEALKTFIADLQSPYRETVYYTNPRTLHECLEQCERYSNLMSRSQRPFSQNNHRPSNNYNSNHHKFKPNFNPNNNRNNNLSQRNFPPKQLPQPQRDAIQQIRNNQNWEPMSARTTSNRQNIRQNLHNLENDHFCDSYPINDNSLYNAEYENNYDDSYNDLPQITYELENNYPEREYQEFLAWKNSKEQKNTENFPIQASSSKDTS